MRTAGAAGRGSHGSPQWEQALTVQGEASRAELISAPRLGQRLHDLRIVRVTGPAPVLPANFLQVSDLDLAGVVRRDLQTKPDGTPSTHGLACGLAHDGGELGLGSLVERVNAVSGGDELMQGSFF
jgi:hypothetical protein